MRPSDILRYYLRDDVIQRLLSVKNRECAVRYGENFGKRPMYFQYPAEIEALVRNGATSFHVSEERWGDPLSLSKESSHADLESNRIGWDLVIDVDCKQLEISKTFGKMLLKKLADEGIRTVSVKFSGGSGFHILVPYGGFPEKVNGIETRKLFPDAPMTISIFLKNQLRDELKEFLEKDYGVKRLAEMFKKPEKELKENDEFNPYSVVDIDTVLISERHMFRMQYSLNEKKWLVSVPLDKNKIQDFQIESAKPENVIADMDFFDIKPSAHESDRLFVEAYDAYQPIEAEEKRAGEFKIENVALDKRFLPPCIRTIDAGLSDGKKRSVFILTNFYRNIGKTKEETMSLLLEWNRKNKPPLKEMLISQQVNYIFSNKAYPPPNCDAAGYYKYFNVCFPDETCRLIKNPLSYYLRLAKTRRETGFKKKKNTESY